MTDDRLTSAYYCEGKCVWPAIPRATGLVQTMHGLGDTLYQRAYIAQMEGAYVVTPWPELLGDLPVKLLKPDLWLHYTNPDDARYAPTPPYIEELDRVRFWYHPMDLEQIEPRTILGTFDRLAKPKKKLVWGMPPLPKSKHPGCAFVRPIAARGMTEEPSRACSPEYIHEAVKQLKAAGYTTVSASWALPGKEILIDPPKCDIEYNEGQLTVLELLALIDEAACAVGPVSWFAPAVFSSRTPSAIIMGGYQGHNAPQQLTHRDMALEHVTWFQTDNPCKCTAMQHRCDKTITGFAEKFQQWLRSVSR